jgi:ubiquinol-cytochrome c reductase cytochrome b subunit
VNRDGDPAQHHVDPQVERVAERAVEQHGMADRPPEQRRGLARAFAWLDERLGISQTIVPVITHPVPKKLGWSYVLGSAVLVCFGLLIVTGVALAMSYVPSTDAAYESLQFITNQALLGRVIRGIHYFSAGAMVTLVFAHMVQVFLIAAYKYPRELTWLSGSILLLLTLAMAFTGQLLRWEQNAYWSIVVAASQIGKTPLIGGQLMQLILAGWTIGPATLTRFFATHVFLIPALIFLFLGTHLYLIVRLGISEPPRAGRPVDPRTYPAFYRELLRRGEPFFPDSFWRDAVAALLVVAAVLALAVVVGPPALGEPPDPTLIQAYPKPDWYFLWYFALLALIPKAAETLVILGFPAVIGVVLLALPFLANRGERAPSRRPWAVAAVAFMFVAFVTLSVVGFREPWAPIIEGYDQVPYPPDVQASLTTPALQRAAALFNAYGCHACHAIGPYGGQRGPALTYIGSDRSREYLVITILAGRGNMPAFGSAIPPTDLETLVDFLLTLRREAPAAGSWR